jgi:S1-C subfamily serine protease
VRAGLRTGDLITAIDGMPVDDPSAFDYRFATKPLGGTAQIVVLRQGRDVALTIALQGLPETPRDEIMIRSRSPFLGAKIANLSPALADELRLDPTTEGVAIVDVSAGSAAQTLGFQRGDVVLSVNNEKIARTADLERVARGGGRQWRITILRGGQQISVMLNG